MSVAEIGIAIGFDTEPIRDEFLDRLEGNPFLFANLVPYHESVILQCVAAEGPGPETRIVMPIIKDGKGALACMAIRNSVPCARDVVDMIRSCRGRIGLILLSASVADAFAEFVSVLDRSGVIKDGKRARDVVVG